MITKLLNKFLIKALISYQINLFSLFQNFFMIDKTLYKTKILDICLSNLLSDCLVNYY